MKKSILALLAVLSLASSCGDFFGSSSSKTGTIAVKIPTSLNSSSKTVVADFTKELDSVIVTVTDSKGNFFSSGSVTDLVSSVSISGLYPGTCSISVSAIKGGVEIGLGSATATISSGTTTSTTVVVSYDSSTGTGKFSLAIAWPTAVGGYASAVLDPDSSAIALTSPIGTSGEDSTATFTKDGLGSGKHILAITFRRSEGDTIVGYALESVNVWRGVTSEYWIDSSGNMRSSRVFTADELFDSTLSLLGLTISGLTTDFSFTASNLSYSGYLATGTSLSFVPTRVIEGQSISYTWNAGASTAIESGLSSGPLAISSAAADGANSLVVTVTAPNKNGSQAYSIAIRKAYTVNFDLNDGALSDGGTFIAAQIIPKGGTATAPTENPTRGTFAFGGWYSDSALTHAWDFATSTVSADTTLYAKWTGSETTGVSVSGLGYQALAFPLARYAIIQNDAFSLTPGNTTLAAISTGWVWYLDGSPTGQTDASFDLTPAQTQAMLGDYLVACTITYKGCQYSASFSLSVAGATEITGATPADLGSNLKAAIAANPAGCYRLAGNASFGADPEIATSTATKFTGIIDGGGFTVTFPIAVTRGFKGFIGVVGPGAVVKNLHVACSIAGGAGNDGGQYTGAIAAINEGTIENCSASGTITVTGGDTVGLVGQNGIDGNTGIISNCYSTVAVSGHGRVGGLVGTFGQTGVNSYIINCYARGSVTSTADGEAGGLVGEMLSGGNIENCYASGAVSGTAPLGGLVGKNTSGSVSSSFYDSAATGQSDTGKGSGQATALMKDQATFEGWDFASVWNIDETLSINNGYPYLRKVSL
jgi:uncharacterized repeat protein (TIGR02543 family)